VPANQFTSFMDADGLEQDGGGGHWQGTAGKTGFPEKVKYFITFCPIRGSQVQLI
jgi:hypothetical protein